MQSGLVAYPDTAFDDVLGKPTRVSFGEYMELCYVLGEKIVRWNIANNREPWTVTVIHRAKPELHRFFNLCDKRLGKAVGIRVKDENQCHGAESYMECLLEGTWKVASNEEIEKCRQRDEQDRQREMKIKETNAVAGARRLMAEAGRLATQGGE